MTEPQAEQNIKEFMEKYGKEGFLELFFTNYLYELSEYYLHSKGKKGEDAGLLFYVDFRGRVYSPQEIEQFRKDLRQACRKRAVLIVQRIKQLDLIEQLCQDPSTNPEVSCMLTESLDEILKELATEGQ